MITHHRACHLCEAMCGLTITTDSHGALTDIRGDEADPLSRGYICPKAAAIADIHADPDRLRRPLKRVGAGWEEIGWEQAFDEVAHRLRKVWRAHGRDAVGVYQGNPNVHNLGSMTAGQLFIRSLRTRNRFSATSADQLPRMLVSQLMYGQQLLMAVPDLSRTDHLLIIGGNPLVSNGSLMTAPGMRRRLAEIRRRGGRVVVIDPRRTETARAADEHHHIRPGTDALLLLAMIRTILDEGLQRLGHLAAHLVGLERVRTACGPYSPERVAATVGIDADRIRSLARGLANAERGVCYGRIGVCTQEFGTLASWAVELLNILTGHMDAVGGALVSNPAIDVADVFAWLGDTGTFDSYRSRVRGLPEYWGELPVVVMAEEMDTPGAGRIRALVTSAGNPVLSIPNGARLERALPSLELMVSVDIYLNETTRHAHYILPPTFGPEDDHYDLALHMMAVHNTTRYSPAIVPRKADQRHDWEIYWELTKRLVGPGPLGGVTRRLLGGLDGLANPRTLVRMGLAHGPYRLDLDAVVAQPHGVDLGPLRPSLIGRLAGRPIQLAPELLLSDMPRLEARIDRPTVPMQLIGRRQLRGNNSWMHNSQRLVKGRDRCTLLMHPNDAARLGIQSGDRVRISSRVGAVLAPVDVSDEMMPGVVSLPHGWGHGRDGIRLGIAAAHPGVSVNDMTDERRIDAISGVCDFSVPVTIDATG